MHMFIPVVLLIKRIIIPTGIQRVLPQKESKFSAYTMGLSECVGNLHQALLLPRKHILTNKICAIRETFEESGLLLSDPPAHTIKELDVNLWRHKVHDDATQFKVMCDQYNIRPAVDTLVPFSNWITPVHEKKRYDTLFFITILNQFKTKQEHDLHYKAVAADGKETVLFNWFKPEEGKCSYI